MRIYLVTRTDHPGYDEFDSWVVVAKTPKQAKALCRWGDGNPKDSDLKVREVKPGKRAKTILGSFNAG